MAEFEIPYTLTVYAAVGDAPPARRYAACYQVAGGIPLWLAGSSEDAVRAKAAERNSVDVAAQVKAAGGAEAMRERLAAAREARKAKADGGGR